MVADRNKAEMACSWRNSRGLSICNHGSIMMNHRLYPLYINLFIEFFRFSSVKTLFVQWVYHYVVFWYIYDVVMITYIYIPFVYCYVEIIGNHGNNLIMWEPWLSGLADRWPLCNWVNLYLNVLLDT
jgi:hypothetical protein